MKKKVDKLNCRGRKLLLLFFIDYMMSDMIETFVLNVVFLRDRIVTINLAKAVQLSLPRKEQVF